MAEARRYSLGGQLDIEQILLEAQHRWLRPAEICEILQNYQKFQIAPEPANMPPSGSLFLFDRKVLRYFRKDGHNWRKKKDGKTVKEAHERLKAGSVDVLHCYYAHGEENENFQRRSYWLLEEERSNIVLVHYLEVKNRNVHRIREAEEVIPRSYGVDAVAGGDIESSFSSNFHPNSYQVRSQTTDTASSNSAQASEYEDAESAYSNQPTSSPFTGLQQTGIENVNSGPTASYYPVAYSNGYQGELSVIPGVDLLSAVNISKGDNIVGSAFENQRHLDIIPHWEEVLKGSFSGGQSAHLPPTSMTEPNELLAHLLTNNVVKKLEPGSGSQVQDEWQAHWSKQPVQSSVMENGQYLKPDLDGIIEGKANYSSLKPFNNALVADGLKKIDSFNRWMSKELGDVDDLCTNSASRSYWDPVDGENGVVDSSISSHEQENTFMLSPSLAQDQLFSIVDFSPNWAYSGSEIKVLITGRFLKSREEAECCKWSCMFGEVEVPAEIVADGVLRCHSPVHKAGRVPFYVTCSNRFACSEVREFEFRVNKSQDVNSVGEKKVNIEILNMRFANLLSTSSSWSASSELSNQLEQSQLSIKISSLLKENDDEWDDMFSLMSGEEFSAEIMKEQMLQKLLKEKLRVWLIMKAAEGGKGASVLDEGGQGVLHFAAALGYDWALEPTIIAGVSVNFRDVHGWTALHWAAFYGRERTVATLIALDAAPGALTDPTPKYPSGRTPADLASASKHKGIAGYLAECALSSHLESINLDGRNGDVGSNVDKAVQSISERHPVSAGDGDLPSGLSLKDSLAAVCNATQAAARIHQIFRIQSFQRKQLKDLGDNKLENSDERALSLLATKAHKPAQTDEPVHAAAVRIQNKFRGWKCRKEFLTTRQHIVRIQAHFRGHRVRKNYPKIMWSVGIVEKIILRWRRKGSGLRGFKREALKESSSMEDTSSKDDDDDFLKEGRKQTEVRLKKALDRVKSMVQYPEARDQYRRLLNEVNEIHETQAKRENALDCSEDAQVFTDDLIDVEDLYDEKMLMSMT